MPFKNQCGFQTVAIQIVLFIIEGSGTGACGFIARDVAPITGGYSVGKEEEERRKASSLF